MKVGRARQLKIVFQILLAAKGRMMLKRHVENKETVDLKWEINVQMYLVKVI
jgi:hypothetical protein